MKICIAQTKPISGDIQRNLENHFLLIDRAVSRKADVVIFPELSLTGYEPKLAKVLATTLDDSRFNIFQDFSNSCQLTIGVGIPTKSTEGICISMILFQPNQPKRTYSKKYLHADEEEFFVSGINFPVLEVNRLKIGLAICYELSIADHLQTAQRAGASIYLASVAKFENGIDKAIDRLADISKTYSMNVLMCNSVGKADGQICAGGSSIWSNGELLGQLNDSEEGLLILDTETNKLFSKLIL